jgi:hypothetical protein
MADHVRTSQQSLARAAAVIIVTEAAQQLELAFALGELIQGDPRIVINPNSNVLDEPPPPKTIEIAEPEPPVKPLSKDEIRRIEAKEARHVALRMKSRRQLRPCQNGRQHSSFRGSRRR